MGADSVAFTVFVVVCFLVGYWIECPTDTWAMEAVKAVVILVAGALAAVGVTLGVEWVQKKRG